jgi:hypothetical protein
MHQRQLSKAEFEASCSQAYNAVKRQNANLPQTQRLASFKANEAPGTHPMLLRVLDRTIWASSFELHHFSRRARPAVERIDDVYENIFGYFYGKLVRARIRAAHNPIIYPSI